MVIMEKSQLSQGFQGLPNLVASNKSCFVLIVRLNCSINALEKNADSEELKLFVLRYKLSQPNYSKTLNVDSKAKEGR